MNVDDGISTHARTFGGAIQKLGQRVLIHLDDVCDRELELVRGPSNKQFLQTRMTNKKTLTTHLCAFILRRFLLASPSDLSENILDLHLR